MNKYDTKFIKNYIEKHKGEIDCVFCGMEEDWDWTEQCVYENGEFSNEFDWKSTSIVVAGIGGSTWATPVMRVFLKDGSEEIIPCFFDDGKQESYERIKMQKFFAKMTGGRPLE